MRGNLSTKIMCRQLSPLFSGLAHVLVLAFITSASWWGEAVFALISLWIRCRRYFAARAELEARAGWIRVVQAQAECHAPPQTDDSPNPYARSCTLIYQLDARGMKHDQVGRHSQGESRPARPRQQTPRIGPVTCRQQALCRHPRR